MNRILEELLRSPTLTAPSGRVFATNVGISEPEVSFLGSIVQNDPSIKATLEVGCALGLSSLTICDALSNRPGARHYIIDPYQQSGWERIGLSNLERAGLLNWELISEGSEFALPALAKSRKGEFDLVFIDGNHTFDHTMIDLFYADILTRVGGYVIVDDASWPSVAKAVSYFADYSTYRVFGKVQQSRGGKAFVKKVVAGVRHNSLLRTIAPAAVLQRANAVAFGTMVAFRKVAAEGPNIASFRPF